MIDILSPLQKALAINLDSQIYGSFAEIGAGQDVAGTFFRAGGASGTIAKSISAYDMVISDTIYGKEESGRYVCASRLDKMLTHEFDQLIDRLKSSRQKDTKFFSYANTVSARNFHGTNQPHGWLGIRFTDDAQKVSELVLHIRMHDNTSQLQQRAIGKLGVNMIHSAFNKFDSISSFLDSLMDNLTVNQIEIDMIKVKGSAFSEFDNRLLNLGLVTKDFTKAVMFNQNGEICLASDELYKKNILVTRGSYRPPTKVNIDVLKTGHDNFSKDINASDIISMCEITTSNLGNGGNIEKEDFLTRVDLLTSLNNRVLITNFPQYFRLTNYLSQFRPTNLALVLGAYNFTQIFDEDYNQIEGGILEAFGRLFKHNIKVYLYPYREDTTCDESISLKNIPVPKKLNHLFEHVKASGQIKDIIGFDDSILHIYSRKVLTMIVNNEDGWEQLVPEAVAKTINEKCLFGHPCFLK